MTACRKREANGLGMGILREKLSTGPLDLTEAADTAARWLCYILELQHDGDWRVCIEDDFVVVARRSASSTLIG